MYPLVALFLLAERAINGLQSFVFKQKGTNMSREKDMYCLHVETRVNINIHFILGLGVFPFKCLPELYVIEERFPWIMGL